MARFSHECMMQKRGSDDGEDDCERRSVVGGLLSELIHIDSHVYLEICVT